MIKKIAIAGLIVFSIATLVFFYFYIQGKKAPATDPLQAVPKSAAVIFKSRDIQSLWKELNQNNIIWQDLSSAEAIKKLNSDFAFIDSVLKTHPEAKQALAGQPLVVSLHSSGDDFHCLFSININEISESAINEIIAKAANAPVTQRAFKSFQLYSVSQDNRIFSWSLLGNNFIASFSPSLLEDAVSTISSGKSLLDNPSFNKIYNTAGAKVEGNIFINYKNLASFLEEHIKEEFSKASSLGSFAEWAVLDLHLKPNDVMLNGFTSVSDSTLQYLSLFAKQKPQEMELARVLPANTVTFFYTGFSNFSAYNNDFRKYQDKINPESGQTIKDFENAYNIDHQTVFLSWIGNEMALAITRPDSLIAKKTFAVFKTAHLESALQALDTLSSRAKEISFNESYKDFKIKRLPAPAGLFKALYGNMFSAVENPYYTNIGRYIIMANDYGSLKNLLDHFTAGRTLEKSEGFQKFSENISEKSNILLYSNIARSTPIYQHFASGEQAEKIAANIDLYRKFEAVAFQYSSNSKFFYNNIYLKYNPVYKEEKNSLWETALDTAITMQPAIVLNHTDNTKEIFVQDEANKIYLISNTGKILWKKQLPEKILSEIHQVDAFKNRKLQLLFNTRSSIYLIDRNGNNVENFPVTLKAEAASPIAVLDYDNNKNYRVLVAGKDNKIYNYTLKGQAIKEWVFESTEAPVTRTIQHMAVNGKDYLSAVDNEGKIYIFDRRGATRLSLKEKLKPARHNDFYIEKGNSLSNTFLVTADSTGTVLKLNFMDELEKISVDEFSPAHFFSYHDANGDDKKDFIFIDKNELKAYNSDKDQLFEYEFPGPASTPPQHFSHAGIAVGVSLLAAEELFLFDEKGSPMPDMPFKGTTSFSIADINNDNRFNLVTGIGKNIVIYTLE